MMPALEQESMQNHIYNSVYEPTQVIDKPPAVPVPPPGSAVLKPLTGTLMIGMVERPYRKARSRLLHHERNYLTKRDDKIPPCVKSLIYELGSPTKLDTG